jgi:hypothetical protein
VLTDNEIAAFIEDGYIVLRQAFPRALAERIVPMVWAHLGIDPDDSSKRREAMVMLEKVIDTPPVPDIYTDRYFGAVDDLCGRGRWRASRGAGYWPIRFPGFANPPWQPPRGGWHLDGRLEHYRLGATDRGLVGLELFTPIAQYDGGTVIRVGSHRDTAQVLHAAEPVGLSERDLNLQTRAKSDHRHVIEMTGDPGDVVLMHPYTVHAASPNTGSRVRILANKPFWLHEPMDLARTDPADYSPVERAVVDALSPAQLVGPTTTTRTVHA